MEFTRHSFVGEKVVRHEVNGNTGEHRQWLVKEDGTEVEIFKGDPDWEE